MYFLKISIFFWKFHFLINIFVFCCFCFRKSQFSGIVSIFIDFFFSIHLPAISIDIKSQFFANLKMIFLSILNQCDIWSFEDEEGENAIGANDIVDAITHRVNKKFSIIMLSLPPRTSKQRILQWQWTFYDFSITVIHRHFTTKDPYTYGPKKNRKKTIMNFYMKKKTRTNWKKAWKLLLHILLLIFGAKIALFFMLIFGAKIVATFLTLIFGAKIITSLLSQFLAWKLLLDFLLIFGGKIQSRIYLFVVSCLSSIFRLFLGLTPSFHLHWNVSELPC